MYENEGLTMSSPENHQPMTGNFLVIALLNPRLEPYFVSQLTTKIKYEANDGISMIVDLAKKEFCMLCHWKKISLVNPDEKAIRVSNVG